MDSILTAAFGTNISANVQFIALALLGSIVGWLMARPCAFSCWLATIAMVGVWGAWLGAEATHLLGQEPRGGPGQLLAAMAGAALMAHAWRRLHPRPEEDDHIAVHRPRA